MKVLLVGGTVFIGRAAAEELAANGHELLFVHRGNHEPEDLPAGEHLHVPRAELASVSSQIEAWGPDAVLDCVALTGDDARIVCEVMPQRTERFVVLSSMDVYRAYAALQAGEGTEAVPVSEGGPVREGRYPYRGQIEGMDHYEKLDVEEAYASRGATILRLPIVYGERDYKRREEFVLRRVRAGRERIPIGSGTWLSTKGWVRDIARGIHIALTTESAQGEVFNLGEEATYPMGAWAQMILDAAGSQAELVRVPDDALPPDLGFTGPVAQHLLCDSSKARRTLGWRTTHHAEALANSVGWHLEHPPQDPDADFAADDEALSRAS